MNKARIASFPSSILLVIMTSVLLFSGCNRDSAKKKLFEVEYLYNFEMPGGLLPQLSHVFRFNHEPTDINGIISKNTLDHVRSASVISAELVNMEADGGLRDVRKMECFIYPYDVDNEYYDIAYTVDLPRKTRDYIQLFSSGDEIKDLYQYDFMDVSLRIWLWEITHRSRKMQYRIRVGFYE